MTPSLSTFIVDILFLERFCFVGGNPIPDLIMDGLCICVLEDKIILGFIAPNDDSVDDNDGDCVTTVWSGIMMSCGGMLVVEYGCGEGGVKGGSNEVLKD